MKQDFFLCYLHVCILDKYVHIQSMQYALLLHNTLLFHFRKLDTLLSLWNFYFPVLPQLQYGYPHVLKTRVLFWIVLEKMMSFTLIMIISLKVVAMPVVKFQVQGYKIQKTKSEFTSKSPQNLGLSLLIKLY